MRDTLLPSPLLPFWLTPLAPDARDARQKGRDMDTETLKAAARGNQITNFLLLNAQVSTCIRVCVCVCACLLLSPDSRLEPTPTGAPTSRVVWPL